MPSLPARAVSIGWKAAPRIRVAFTNGEVHSLGSVIGGVSNTSHGYCGAAILHEADWERIASSFRLSAREITIVRAVFDDKKEEMISRELGISHHTVHAYVERVYAKLGVNSRTQLVVSVMNRHLAIAVP